MSKREDVKDDRPRSARSLGAGAIGDSDRRRPPEVHHAQRRDLGGRGDERLRAIGDRKERLLRQPPQPHRSGGSRGARCPAGCRPERGEEGEGPGDDDRGRVLQGRPGPFELAHDRSDAHHLRFLPARHQAAGRQARQGDEASGEPVRQPQRDRQGTRHGARRARRAGREGTGDGRPEVPRRPARQA